MHNTHISFQIYFSSIATNICTFCESISALCMMLGDVTLCMILGDVTLCMLCMLLVDVIPCMTLGDVLTLEDVEGMMRSDLTWQTLFEYAQRQCHNDSRNLSKLFKSYAHYNSNMYCI